MTPHGPHPLGPVLSHRRSEPERCLLLPPVFVSDLYRRSGRPIESIIPSVGSIEEGEGEDAGESSGKLGPLASFRRSEFWKYGPQSCSLLSVGQTFSGTQNVSSLQNEKDVAWRVNVFIQGCDLDHGYLCGTMEALNVPMADTPVVTFWEGEIVDTKNYTFFTGEWEATREDDIRHWTKFPSFAPLLSYVEADGGKILGPQQFPVHIYEMEEQYFVNVGDDSGLTIAGFYYVRFSFVDGSINGFYYDPKSSPFQKLELKSTNAGRSGFIFPAYELQ